MTAYYNEKDSNAAAWLRELIAQGHIAPGEVDERSIVDVRSGDLAGFDQCHFFAGIGGWSLALRYAGWGDHTPVWTGSCPCQPFSAAGKRKGFDDERHLWPEFRRLIAERRPAIVFGEQVASASDWLRLVRGDLEALEYAVGAMPIEAASAGADHLRDRFWFVADANDARLQGRPLSAERAGEWSAGPDGLAHADEPQRRLGDEQPAGQQPEQQQDTRARALGDAASVGRGEGRPEHEVWSGRATAASASSSGLDLAEPERDGAGCGSGDRAGEEATAQRKHWRSSGASFAPRLDGEEYEWAIGADGKARRVKPGVRLLVDGFPSRVGLLRGFGNAIDPRPAAAFIASAREAISLAAGGD